MIKYSKSITALDFSGRKSRIYVVIIVENLIRVDGAKLVGKILQINKSISSLNLRGRDVNINIAYDHVNLETNLKDEGLKYLSEGLKVNYSLHTLNLAGRTFQLFFLLVSSVRYLYWSRRISLFE
jgi:hypothetical protein